MASPTVNRQVNVYIASGEAEKAYDRLIKKEKSLKDELVKATDPKVIQRLKSEIDKLQEPLDRASKKLKGELNPSIRDLQTTLSSLNREIQNVDIGSEKFNRLSVAIARTNVELKQARTSANQMDQSIGKKAFGGVSSFLQGAGIGVGVASIQAVGSAVRNFFEDSIEEALQAEENAARFKNTLDNIGRVDAFDRLAEKAQKLADKLKYIDNDDVLEVFNKLVTYGKLTERQIDQLTPIIIDFAAKQKISLDESASVIIKALEGQGKALKVYGIDLKTAEDSTERFNLVATTLKQKVDGAAESFGESLPGAIAKSEQRLKDIEENIGTKLLPLKVKLLSFANDVITGFQKLGNTLSVAFELGVNPFTADKLIREAETFKKFTTDQAEKEFDAMRDLPVDELTTKLVELNAELDKTEKLLSGAKSQGDINSDRAERYRLRIQVIKNLIPQLKNQINEADKLLGGGGTEEEEKKVKEIENLYAKYAATLKQQAKDLELFNAQQVDKDLNASADKYAKLQQQLVDSYNKKQLTDQQFSELTNEVVELREKEHALILENWGKEITKKALEEQKKRDAEAKALDDKRLAQLQTYQSELAKGAADIADRSLNQTRFSEEVKLLTANNKERLQIKITQLERERQQELLNAQKTGKDVYDIIKYYDELIKKEKEDSKISFGQEIVSYISSVSGMVSEFFNMQAQKEQESLELFEQSATRKADLYKRQLDSNVINQKEYDRKVSELDRQKEEREKQARIREFNRNKITALLNAAVNIAEAITKAFTAGPIAGQVLAGLTAVAGAVQVGIIAAQKPPSYGRGGKLRGPAHTDRSQGMPVTDPHTGAVQAYLEGNEGIINKRSMADPRRYDLSGTISQIASTINAMHGGVSWDGKAAFVPVWKKQSPAYIDQQGALRNIQTVRRFETGGVFTPALAAAGGSVPADNMQDDRLVQAIDLLNNILANGVRSYVVISDINQQQDRVNTIQNDATIRQS